jgi:hypothetical protein
MVQLHKLAFALKNSTTILLPQWYKTLTAHKLPPCMMVHNVTTCWNSTYGMLVFAVQYRPAIDAMTAIRNLDLGKYELASSEWKIAAELPMSSDSPYKFCVAIRAALAIGKSAMNRYYNKTDQSEVYHIAMDLVFYYSNISYLLISIYLVLHPHHKLEYFKKHNWKEL